MQYKQELFGYGLFIRKDDFGQDCFIGDHIEITYPKMYFNNMMEKWERKEDITFTGTLVLLKSKGVLIRSDKTNSLKYFKPVLAKSSVRINKWRKL